MKPLNKPKKVLRNVAPAGLPPRPKTQRCSRPLATPLQVAPQIVDSAISTAPSEKPVPTILDGSTLHVSDAAVAVSAAAGSSEGTSSESLAAAKLIQTSINKLTEAMTVLGVPQTQSRSVAPPSDPAAEAALKSKRLLDEDALKRLTRFSGATLAKWIKEGSFPKPVMEGRRKTRWLASDVEAWLDCLKNASDADQGTEGKA